MQLTDDNNVSAIITTIVTLRLAHYNSLDSHPGVGAKQMPWAALPLDTNYIIKNFVVVLLF